MEMNSSPLIANSETEVEAPNIVGPTPPKRNASDRSKRRLTFPDTGGDQVSFVCFDRSGSILPYQRIRRVWASLHLRELVCRDLFK